MNLKQFVNAMLTLHFKSVPCHFLIDHGNGIPDNIISYLFRYVNKGINSVIRFSEVALRIDSLNILTVEPNRDIIFKINTVVF